MYNSVVFIQLPFGRIYFTRKKKWWIAFIQLSSAVFCEVKFNFTICLSFSLLVDDVLFFILSFSLPFSSWYPSILSIKKFYWDFKCKYSCICLRSTIATGQTENFQQACKQKMSCYWKRAQILTQSLFCINNGCGSFCKYWNNWTSLPISAKLQNAIRFDEKFTSIKEQCANLLKFLNSSWIMIYVCRENYLGAPCWNSCSNRSWTNFESYIQSST